MYRFQPRYQDINHYSAVLTPQRTAAPGEVNPKSPRWLDTDDVAIRANARKLYPRDVLAALLSQYPGGLTKDQIRQKLDVLWLAVNKQDSLLWDRIRKALGGRRVKRPFTLLDGLYTLN